MTKKTAKRLSQASQLLLPWTKPYIAHLCNTGGNEAKELLDDLDNNRHMLSSNIVRYILAEAVHSQLVFLHRLKANGLLQPLA